MAKIRFLFHVAFPIALALSGNVVRAEGIQKVSPGQTQPAPGQAQPASAEERWRNYARDSFLSPGAFFASVMPALGDQRNDRPAEFGQGWDAFGNRLGRRVAQYQLQTALFHASAAALRTETRYRRCDCAGGLERLGFALSRSFLTRTDSGATIPNAPLLGGAIGASVIANTWYPAGYRSGAEIARGAGIQVGMRAGFNVLREFSPELKRFFLRR